MLFLGILPQEHYDIVIGITNIIKELWGPRIQRSRLDEMRAQLRLLLLKAQRYFGLTIMTTNFHDLMFHLIDMVEAAGPLWAFSTFVTEAFNHLIVTCLHGTTRVEESCLTQVLGFQSLEYLVTNIQSDDMLDAIARFDSRTNKIGARLPKGWTRVKKNGPAEHELHVISHSECYIVGARTLTNDTSSGRQRVICTFDALWKQGTMIQSAKKQANERACDSIITYRLNDSDQELFGEVQFFTLIQHTIDGREAVQIAVIPIPCADDVIRGRGQMGNEIVFVSEKQYCGPAVGIRLTDGSVCGRKFVTPENGLIL